MGDTDPRLFDTDGDGAGDAASGASVCRAGALIPVSSRKVGPIQLAVTPNLGMVDDVAGSGAGRAAVTVEDAVAGVAGLVVSGPTMGGDVRADASSYEATVRAAAPFALSAVITGVAMTTPEGLPAIRSQYFGMSGGTMSASLVRDGFVGSLTGGGMPVGGRSSGAGNSRFLVWVTTVRRSATAVDVVVAVAPEPAHSDPSTTTAMTVEQLAGGTVVADATRTFDAGCQGALSPQYAALDLLWTVDTSTGMDGIQTSIANYANTFVARLRASGIDTRLGVFAAEGDPAQTIDLTATTFTGFPAGFEFITSGSTNADRLLCRQVTATTSGTMGFCPPDMNKTIDPISPFGTNMAGSQEEPLAAGVRLVDLFKRNMSNGTSNAAWSFRRSALRSVLLVTNEPTSATGTETNDFTRYFASALNPDTGVAFAPAGVFSPTAQNNIVAYFKNNQVLLYGLVPVFGARTCGVNADARDLPRCVVEGAGGFAADSLTGPTAGIATITDRLLSTVASSTGRVTLPRPAIVGSLKVTVNGVAVPRSRVNGFDYLSASKELVFFGDTYRPAKGDAVYVSYRSFSGTTG